MIETHPFGDFYPEGARYLILGSFVAKKYEGDDSFNWFYGSKRNQFWHILAMIYGVELKTKKDKKQILARYGIALSDIIRQCERRDGNSLDVNLVNVVYNINGLRFLLKKGTIKTILFSSRFAEKQFHAHFGEIIEQFPKIRLITLPSPSPRYAAITMRGKVKRYGRLLPRVEHKHKAVTQIPVFRNPRQK